MRPRRPVEKPPARPHPPRGRLGPFPFPEAPRRLSVPGGGARKRFGPPPPPPLPARPPLPRHEARAAPGRVSASGGPVANFPPHTPHGAKFARVPATPTPAPGGEKWTRGGSGRGGGGAAAAPSPGGGGGGETWLLRRRPPRLSSPQAASHRRPPPPPSRRGPATHRRRAAGS